MSYSPVTDRAAIRSEVQRILQSPPFEDADRLVRFLNFVVEEALDGKAPLLKESVIGVEVFGRPPGYDSKIDPIVRVQARRLRAKLDAWYETGGRDSAVRIALPKGCYAPEFTLPVPVPSDVAAPVAESPAAAPPPSPTRHILRWLGPTAALVALAVAAIILTSSRIRPPAPGSRLFTAYAGYQTTPAFSPDGLTLAFAWGGPEGGTLGIYVQPLDADTPRRLTASPLQERNPIWLPDGRHVAFLRDDVPGRFAVMVAPLLGSGERRVAEIAADSSAPPRIEWSHDGRSIFTAEAPVPGQPTRIVQIDLETGGRRNLVPPVSQGPAAGTPGDDEVHVSPNGKWLAFRRRTASVVGDIFVAPSAGGEPRPVTHDRTGIAGLAWSRDGQSLVVSSQRQSGLVRLWRFPLGSGAPVCLTDAALSASFPAISPRDGQIAFSSRYFDTNIWRVDLQGNPPGGKAASQRLIASNLLDSCPRYSPDGERIVFRSNRTGSDEIWVADAAGHSPVRLTTFGGPVTGSPRWSPDGQYVTFDSRPDGSADVFVVAAGGGQPRKLTRETSNEVTPGFSADGKSVYFASDRTGEWQIWKQRVDGGEAQRITGSGGFSPQESADGKWLYYAKLGSGGLYRISTAGGPETNVLPSLPAAFWGGWALSGDRIIYAALSQPSDSAPGELRQFDTGTGRTRTLAVLRFAPVQWDGSVAISADGRYALVTEVERQGSEIHLQPER